MRCLMHRSTPARNDGLPSLASFFFVVSVESGASEKIFTFLDFDLAGLIDRSHAFQYSLSNLSKRANSSAFRSEKAMTARSHYIARMAFRSLEVVPCKTPMISAISYWLRPARYSSAVICKSLSRLVGSRLLLIISLSQKFLLHKNSI